jgi:kynureninase
LDAGERGSQVSFSHKSGYEIVQALIAQGIICDYRQPDILRFGFSPLYNSHRDVVKTVELLNDIVKNKRYLDPEYGVRHGVT